MKKQVLESPFIKKEFLKLVNHVSNTQDMKHEYFAINNSSIVNIGSREFIDYRPSIVFRKNFLEDNNIENINFDSLHFFQIQELVTNVNFDSIKIKKADVSVNLILPDSYKEYLQNLPKKKRHELNRKKRKFEERIESFKLSESKDQSIFKIFISQHRDSKGEKGKFMTDEVESYFKNLLNMDGWKIYYTDTDKGVLSTAFCYENEYGCYLYNSSRNNEFNSVNPGIIINDLIIQELIKQKLSFFDFLKGTERYKYDLGGKSIQLYDLTMKL